MKAVVVYESMYGNTHLIADAIAEGLREHGEVVVVPVHQADTALIDSADLVVVGGPTHAHGMSRTETRRMAAEAADKPGATVERDADAEGDGLREWFDTIGDLDKDAAAFDTRFAFAAALTGRASKGIARQLHHRRARLLCAPESFLVTRDNHLEPDEQARAREWGYRLGYEIDGRGVEIGIYPPAAPWPRHDTQPTHLWPEK